MAIIFDTIISAPAPTGGDTGSQLADKINNNFSKLINSDMASGISVSSSLSSKWGVNNVDGVLDRMNDISSYIAFCTNANTASLDCAFGKNGEEYTQNLGLQLAMYNWFLGVSKTTYPYTNLKTKKNMTDIYADRLSFGELFEHSNLVDLVYRSPYARSLITPLTKNYSYNTATKTFSNGLGNFALTEGTTEGTPTIYNGTALAYFGFNATNAYTASGLFTYATPYFTASSDALILETIVATLTNVNASQQWPSANFVLEEETTGNITTIFSRTAVLQPNEAYSYNIKYLKLPVTAGKKYRLRYNSNMSAWKQQMDLKITGVFCV